MFKRLFMAFILLLLMCPDARPQKLLFHKSRFREVTYKPGDKIAFRLKGDRTKISAQILGFEDSLVVFKDMMVDPSKISHMYVDKKTRSWFFLRYKYEKIFLIAGVGYGVLDVLNTGEFDAQTWKASAVLVGAGLLAKVLIKDTIRIKGRRRLVILH